MKLLELDEWKELKPELTEEESKTEEKKIETTLQHLQKLMDEKNDKSLELLKKVREESAKQYEVLKKYHPKNKNFIHWEKSNDDFDKFEKEILEQLTNEENKYTLILIDFFADWCPPCRMITRDYIKLSIENKNVLFIKINTDECPTICKNAKYNIECMPTLSILFLSFFIFSFFYFFILYLYLFVFVVFAIF